MEITKILWLLSSLLVTTNASGEFSVLSYPKSISFKGSDVLQSQYVGDVVNAAVGNDIPGDAQWTGMTIVDPFSLAKGLIAVYIDGVAHISLDSTAKTYSMEGNDAANALNDLTSDLSVENTAVCDIDFNEFEEGVANFRSCFGDVDAPAVKTGNLNPALHSEDKQFLQSISLLMAASDYLNDMERPSNFVIFRLSLEPISKAHGEKSEAMAEAIKLTSTAVSKLNIAAQKSRNLDALVLAITDKSLGGRFKREGETAPARPASKASNNPYNIADYYDENYPVIFNIILWFMVTFGFALLAICYAIGTMDPGRDSIIYRMTSTRMKKDN